MHRAATAYSQTHRQTANPRELEAQLLLKAGAKLQSIIEGYTTDPEQVQEALNYNRRLWTVLLSAVMEPGNPLPQDLKQNFANLAVFVVSHTRAVELDPQVEHMNVLVRFNREIAQGLRGNGADASAEQPAA